MCSGAQKVARIWANFLLMRFAVNLAGEFREQASQLCSLSLSFEKDFVRLRSSRSAVHVALRKASFKLSKQILHCLMHLASVYTIIAIVLLKKNQARLGKFFPLALALPILLQSTILKLMLVRFALGKVLRTFLAMLEKSVKLLLVHCCPLQYCSR